MSVISTIVAAYNAVPGWSGLGPVPMGSGGSGSGGGDPAIDLRSAGVAQYKMNDDEASTVVVDSIGFSNGTAQQNTEDLHTTGKIGGAFSFDGTGIVDTGSSFESVFKKDFTIALWYNAQRKALSILDTSNEGTVTDNYFVFFDFYTTSNNEPDQYQVTYVTNGDRITYRFIDSNHDAWVFYACVIKQVDASHIEMNFYVGGQLAYTSIGAGIMADYANNHSLIMGSLGSSVDENVDLIDNVMIFNKALSIEEIAFLYNSGNGTEELYGDLPSSGSFVGHRSRRR